MKPARDFRFRQFTVCQQDSTHRIGTDAVLLGAWVNVADTTRILDIGTGTGVIALMLAQRTADTVIIDGIEIQPTDAARARDNAEQSKWKHRIQITQASLQAFDSTQYDLIVTNPPFFINSLKPSSDGRTMVRHTDSLSFDDLIRHTNRLLSDTGVFALILPPKEAALFRIKANLAGLYPSRQCEVRSRPGKAVERVMIEFQRVPCPVKNQTLVLHEDGTQRSPEYHDLTREFYLEN